MNKLLGMRRAMDAYERRNAPDDIDAEIDREIEVAIAADLDGVENERLRAEAYALNAAADPTETQRLVELGMQVVNRLLATPAATRSCERGVR